jgi:hypothetical protein
MILNDRVSGKLSAGGILLIGCLAVVALPCWSPAQTQTPTDAAPAATNADDPKQETPRRGDQRGTEADRGQAQLERAFGGYDKNKDGKVTLEEFIAALGGKDNPKVRAMAAQQFDVADRNGDKSVSFEEFLAAGKHE